MKRVVKYFPLLAILILIVLLKLSFLYSNSKINNNQYDAKSALLNIRNKTPKVFEYIREKLPSTVKEMGIIGTVKLTKEAFREEAITMYQCHTLSHLIGHSSVLSFSNNTSMLKEVGVDFCEGGFKHGLEAEIALKGLHENYDFRPEIYRFCSFLLKESSIGDCYHGAGHEFMRYTLDPENALGLCETLTEGPIKDVTNCYNGVFSEYTNLVGGVDGETGYKLSTGPVLHLAGTPLDFCAGLSKQEQQVACAHELNGILIRDNPSLKDLENALSTCLKGNYPTVLQEACMRSVAAVYVQQVLPANKTIDHPALIVRLAPNLRRAYISGVGQEMSQFLINGVKRDWQTFCNSLPKDDFSFCTGIFAEI